MSCLCDLTEFQTVIGNIDIGRDSERGTPWEGVGSNKAWLEITLILSRISRRYRQGFKV